MHLPEREFGDRDRGPSRQAEDLGQVLCAEMSEVILLIELAAKLLEI
ncbi:hypothetical protein [Bradyrhizobium elkanii]|uniref:Uncharacterized protein n=1 Tax=Bradyrhizobium elkanii TaxID=29448 RepID=A0A8I2C7M2_BRAEL|nr:hypothetical protein [Bradyrhizobium elkanii]MBP1297458.1 hypothetical protein [Bradyrhizobium elkanii]